MRSIAALFLATVIASCGQAPPPTVTAQEFRQIDTGMSYAEVRRIIGEPGEEMSRNEIAGNETVMYQWVNPDGSNMNAMFQNGDLVQKAQFGLR